jgi:hypothetical protein
VPEKCETCFPEKILAGLVAFVLPETHPSWSQILGQNFRGGPDKIVKSKNKS